MDFGENRAILEHDRRTGSSGTTKTGRVILGSDKTTVSVATGHNEYYPLYGSAGNAQSHVRRAHRNAVSIIGFLAIPKSAYHFSSNCMTS
jgi:hypothetical protein